jgi:uncharacterized membrane protein YesL
MTAIDLVIVTAAGVAGVTAGLLVLGVVWTVRAAVALYRTWLDGK